jgi:cephalosporin hydroxylase
VLPPRVEIDLSDTVRSYWHARVAQHVQDSYLDIPLLKFPEDLRVYEHLLWESGASVVIELGTKYGGSALWFHDRLQAFARHGRIRNPIVISVDRRQKSARAAMARVGASASSVNLIEGDVLDPRLPAVVAECIPPGATCLVVEDTAHRFDTTLAALHGFSRFVEPGGYFVVEDGCVDVEEMRADPTWPRGVLPAIDKFLSSPEGERFEVRRDLERYGMSCHVGGFLQRRRTAAGEASESAGTLSQSTEAGAKWPLRGPLRGRRLFRAPRNVA